MVFEGRGCEVDGSVDARSRLSAEVVVRDIGPADGR